MEYAAITTYFPYTTLNKLILSTERDCYCVRCKAEFTFDKINEWYFDIHIDGSYKAETACCARCGIDTVISRKYSLNKEKERTGLTESQILEVWHYKANN